MRALASAFRETLQLFGGQRLLWMPFLATAFLEALLLLGVWLAPYAPFSGLLAPPIRFYFGEHVLHYPAHLWFLYHVTKHTHLAASVLFGAFMTGLACVMVEQVHTNQRPSFRDALVSKRAPYGRMVILWVLSWAIAKGAFVLLAEVMPETWWVLWTGILAALVLQTLFVYAIPAAVFGRASWWRALGRGVAEAVKSPLDSFAWVALCMSPVLLVTVLAPSAWVARLVANADVPEIALAFLGMRFIVWIVCDAFMTVGIAHLWWARRSLAAAS